MKLYAHPFSAYCQKAIIALYGNDTPFKFSMLGPDRPDMQEDFEALWPIKRFPILVDEARPCRTLFPLGAPDRV